MGSGGGSDVSYEQSPWEAQMYKHAFPMVKDVWKNGGQNFTNQFADMMQPTRGWYDNLSPEVMQGIWEPYNSGAQQMLEQMGAAGYGGSPEGGYSGAAGAAMGRYYADASQQVGMDAWNMGAGYRNTMLLPYTSALNAVGGQTGNAVVDPGSNQAAGIVGMGMTGAAAGGMIGGMYAGGEAGSMAGPYGAAIGAVAGAGLGWLTS